MNISTNDQGLTVVFGAPQRNIEKIKKSINIKNPLKGLGSKLTSAGSTVLNFATTNAGAVYNKATDLVSDAAASVKNTLDGFVESLYHAPGVTRGQVDYVRNNSKATIIGTYDKMVEEEGNVFVHGEFIKNEFGEDADELYVVQLSSPSQEDEPVRIGETNHQVVMAPVMKKIGNTPMFMYKFILVSLTDKSIWLLEAPVPEEELVSAAQDLAIANQRVESLIK